MTNARASRKRHSTEQRLIDERNSLLDVLNALMNLVSPDHGIIAIPLEHYLGKPRHPIYTLPDPRGVIVKQDRDQVVTDIGQGLIILPEVSV